MVPDTVAAGVRSDLRSNVCIQKAGQRRCKVRRTVLLRALVWKSTWVEYCEYLWLPSVGARRLAGTMLKFALAWYDLRADDAAAGGPAQLQ